MNNIASLSTRINRIIKQVERTRKPKTWSFVLGLGEEIPEETRAKFGPHDMVYIRRFNVDLSRV